MIQRQEITSRYQVHAITHRFFAELHMWLGDFFWRCAGAGSIAQGHYQSCGAALAALAALEAGGGVG